MKLSALAVTAVAVAALIGGTASAQDTTAPAATPPDTTSTATAPAATMQPVPNPAGASATSMARGGKHHRTGKSRGKPAKSHRAKGGKMAKPHKGGKMAKPAKKGAKMGSMGAAPATPAPAPPPPA